MIKCPNCGQENAENSKFCRSCGAKIEISHSYYKCSKCGSKITDEQAFCNICGSKLVYASGENEAFALPENSSKPSYRVESTRNAGLTFSKIIKIVVSSLLILVALFSIISVYCPFAKIITTDSVDITQSSDLIFGIKYWFKDGWTSIFKNSFEPYIGENINIPFGLYASATQFVLNFLSFIFAIVSSLVFGIIAIIKLAKGIKRNYYDFNFKLVLLSLIGPLQYFAFTFISIYSFSNITEIDYFSLTVATHYGSGYSLLISALMIFIVSFILYKVIKMVENHKFDLSFVFKAIILILGSIISFSTLKSSARISIVDGYDLLDIKESIFSIISGLDSNNFLITKFLSLLTYVLIIACLCLAIFLVLLALNVINKEAKSVNLIIISSLMIVFGVASIVLSKESLVNYYIDIEYMYAHSNGVSPEIINEIRDYVKIAPGIISFVILSIISLGCSITNKVLERKQ